MMQDLWLRVFNIDNIKDEDIKPILRDLISNCYWISKCLVWQEEEIKRNYNRCDMAHASIIEWFDFDRI